MKKSLYLPVFEQGFLDDNEELLPGLLEDRATLRHVLAFCSNFRRAGIAALLQTGRASVFRTRLQRSGRAYVHFLKNAREQGKRTSESLPLFDAISAGDLASAAEIARLSRHNWMTDEEYEEDFLFYEFIMQHEFLNATGELTASLLDRWGACLQGNEDPRLEVCRALFASDGEAFHQALAAFLEERRHVFEERADRTEPEVMATEASLSVEGVALLRLARRKGAARAAEYPQVPKPAMDDKPMVWQPDSFTEIA